MVEAFCHCERSEAILYVPSEMVSSLSLLAMTDSKVSDGAFTRCSLRSLR